MNPTNTVTKTADVRLRLEPELKEEVTRILADAGLDISTAVRLFFRKVAADGGLPFDVGRPNAVTVRAMKEARSIAKPRYGSAKELFDGLEKGGKGTRRPASKKK